YSFEPLADCYTQLIQTMQHVPAFNALNFGLGDQTLEGEMFRSDFTPSSSLLPMSDVSKKAFPFVDKGWKSELIKIRRLDDVAAELTLPDNLLIKVDVQGFEDRVIKGGWNTIRRAVVL